MAPRGNVLLASLTVTLALVLGACGDPSRPTAPSATTSAPAFTASSGATLLECPVDTTVRASGIVDLLGGSISAGGTTINIPAGAVLLPTEFEVVVPASKYMEVSITGGGQEHFDFLEPVTISIDYSRCSRSNIDKGPLSVYYIDEASKALLENMGGTDDKESRRITFGTDHLSGYAIAN